MDLRFILIIYQIDFTFPFHSSPAFSKIDYLIAKNMPLTMIYTHKSF